MTTKIKDRFVCVHGHFYQPPRENPWLEDVEKQLSAIPFHDWNARITEECYHPNAAAKILNAQGGTVELINNYLLMSFNFGPTLLTWLKKKSPWTYKQILAADRDSLKLRGGHGNAIAQVYNHIIMPLASRADKITQVHWGLRDFEKTFGRKAEGMWLAECAVDSETLEVLSEAGVKFTILAPRQAGRARLADSDGNWKDVSNAGIDTTRPYHWQGKNGRGLTIFFYNAPVSQAIAFAGLLHSGDRLAEKLLEPSGAPGKVALTHVAVDGETFGHHHRFGEMALAWCLSRLARDNEARLTNYGEFLEKNPPRDEVEIIENTSWSCDHGVERWRSDCGCRVSNNPGWDQKWRAPLRAALDHLRDGIDALYSERAALFVKDPWHARNDYIDVVYDETEAAAAAFFKKHQKHPLEKTEQIMLLNLLEMQRYRIFMFTSCGWFFDDIGGTEAQTILMYAARAIGYAELFSGGRELRWKFTSELIKARSNDPELGTGASIFTYCVDTQTYDARSVAASLAFRFFLGEDLSDQILHGYRVKALETLFSKPHPLSPSLALARVRLTSVRTLDTFELGCVVFQNREKREPWCYIKNDADGAFFANLAGALKDKWQSTPLIDPADALKPFFKHPPLTLDDIFSDDRRELLS
jgi:alpha-amylase/alpha-mannosidase (GH57 family)